jgi:plastocyanin
MRPLLRGAAIALAGLALAACSSSSDGATTPGGGSNAGGAVITIKDFGYGSPITVAPGATVTVRQEDSVKHDVSATAFKTDLLGMGESGTFTAPNQPGTYEYTCSVHPQMHGKLIVQVGAQPSATDSGDSGPGGY